MKIKLFLLFFPVLILYGCSSLKEVKIIPREEWNALDPKPYQSHIPEKITIHHEGTFFPDDKDAAAHIRNVQRWGMGNDRNWSDIPYHFLIDRNGNIFEGRNVFTAGETATEYDPSGHLLITCIGNYNKQEITEKQLESLLDLIAFSCIKYQVSPSTIEGHKDFARTACPGDNLYKIIKDDSFIKKVEKRITELQIH
jgi:N-acetyl-anhydromuramyl-L-alanine amidase AmpD